MQEQLINLETAKLAKEKGFDIPQNKMFSTIIDRSIFNKTDNPEVIKFHNGDQNQCSNIPHDWNNTKSQTPTKYYSAPTQSLLQKWLREVHNMHIGIMNNIGTFHYQIDIRPINKETFDKLQWNHINIGNRITYEEALERGLQEALKLI